MVIGSVGILLEELVILDQLGFLKGELYMYKEGKGKKRSGRTAVRNKMRRYSTVMMSVYYNRAHLLPLIIMAANSFY